MGECIIAKRGGDSKVGTTSCMLRLQATVQNLAASDFSGTPLRAGDFIIGRYLYSNGNYYPVFGYYSADIPDTILVVSSENMNVMATIVFDVYRPN